MSIRQPLPHERWCGATVESARSGIAARHAIDEAQKRRLQVLVRMGGRGMTMPGMMGRGMMGTGGSMMPGGSDDGDDEDDG